MTGIPFLTPVLSRAKLGYKQEFFRGLGLFENW